MATLLQSDSRRMYSWWWDSHISPKNSKWLQENLTDMDAKVKAMIKLIEEDADSFARRAEMYYKKRPELMKLVEEFYRAYRALAERYDHATGALRQAHRTMAEAFPNQVPYVLVDDSPSGSSATDAEPHTPEMPHPLRALFDPDDLQKDALGLSSSQFHAIKRHGANSEEADSLTTKKGLKQFNELFCSGEEADHHAKFSEGRVRKGLNFHEEDGKGSEYKVHNGSRDLPKHEVEEEERSLQDGVSDVSTENQNLKTQVISESVQAGKAATEVHNLKEALAKLEAEKENGILQYQQSLDRLSNLEREISRAQDDAARLNDRASKAETEVQTQKQALAKLEAEKEAGLVQYQKCLGRISALESKISCFEEDAGGLNERASKAETEAQSLREAFTRSEAEKEAGLVQYKQSLETISNLEAKISSAGDDARRLNERADKAENDVQSLTQSIAKLNEEKEAAALQYQRCLEIEISRAQGEARRLNNEIAMGAAKLKSADEKHLLLEKANQALQVEVDTLSQKTGIQRQELLDKHEEVEKLRICIQEEGLRSMQAEASLQTLQNVQSQSREEQRALAMELQKRVLMLKDMELWNQGLEDEVQRVKEENKNLKEQNLSSAMSINNLQDEIFRLKEMTGKLEEEVELRLDQRNALQQEIYCLKEEINDLNKRHQGLIEQVQLVGLNPDSLKESVKELQDENSKLKEICQKDKDEKVALSEKLENMEKLLEKNALLENSISDANAELEGSRDKVQALEESYQSLQGEKFTLVAEKATLVSQLEIATQNMEKLLEKNTLLENSLSDTNAELESLREKSKTLEESCRSLGNERSGLLTERDTLVSHLKTFQERLEELERRYTELEDKYLGLEKEKDSTIYQVKELRASLDLEKQEHGNFVLSSETRLASLEDQIRLLQEEGRWRRKEFEEEQDKAIKAQVEIIILQRCIRDMEEKNFSLLIECQKHFEESKLSKKLISELEQEYLEQQIEANSLLNQLEKLRMGIHQVLKSLKIDPDYECQDTIEEDQLLLQRILGKIEYSECCLLKEQDEKQCLLFEKSVLVTLLEQLRLEAADLESERNTLDWEFKIRTEELVILQSEKQELLEMNGQLRLELRAGDQREEVLKTEMEHLRSKLSDSQEAYLVLQNEKSKLLEGNRSLMKEFSQLEEEKDMLEEENSLILGEAIALSNLSLIFKSFGAEKAVELEGLGQDLNHLNGVKGGLEEDVIKMGEKLEMVEAEKLLLKESVEKLGNELNTVKNASDDLNHQLGIGKNILSQKEIELSDVEQKLIATESKNGELHSHVQSLKRDYDEARVTIEELEKKILELSEDNVHQKKESGCLHEANEKLKSELAKLHEEISDHKIREENLSFELQEKRNEVELREAEAATLYGDLQISTVCATLFKEKVHELIGACENLEDESASKRLEIEKLEERVCTLEGENGGLKAKSAEYFPIIVSVRDSLTSIEDHVISRTKILIADNQEMKDAELASDLHGESFEEPSNDRNPVVTDGVSDLQELQTRVQAVEKALMEMECLTMQESIVTQIKLDAAMKEIKELKSTSGDIVMQLEEVRRDEPGNIKVQKSEAEISKMRNGIVMKDIPLDHVSESLSYEHGFGPHGTRRENSETDDQMLELWETTEQDCIMDHHINKAEMVRSAPTEEDNRYQQIEALEEQKSEYPSSELQMEKELVVDKQEVSKIFGDSHQGNKRKILERLVSDAQKLTNLQITVQDLKKKVEMSNKSKKASGTEYDAVNGQLQEVEEAIVQLVNLNGKLTKNAEETSSPGDGKAAEGSEDTGKVRKRRVSEQARRGSEKIGRLQLEVQRIQFLLLKLEDEHRIKGANTTKRSTRVLLRDYIYGGGRNGQRRKKAPCCACVRPATKGE